MSSSPFTSLSIHFIGGGNMATCILGGLIAKGVPKANLIVSEPNTDRAQWLIETYGIQAGPNQDATQAEVVILAIKPQIMDTVLSALSTQIGPNTMVISVAAGITLSTLANALGSQRPLVRAMPNTPALVQCGATGLYGTQLQPDNKEAAQAIMDCVGLSCWVENESLLDTITAVSGSGPAYFFLLMESMIASGQALGLDQRACTELVIQTALGAATLAKHHLDQGSDSPYELRQKVTSPGGTTAAAINHMIDSNLQAIVAQALQKARDRAIELGKQN